MEQASEKTPRLIACIVAGKTAGEAYPSLVHYLQLGLTAEHIDVVRIILQGESLATLQHGTNVVLEDQPLAWPLSHWSRKTLVEQVRRKVDAVRREAPIVVHALGPDAMPVAATIAEAMGGELIVTVSSLSQATEAGCTKVLEHAAAIVCLSTRIRDAIPGTLRSGRPVEIVPVGLSAEEQPTAFSSQDRAPVLLFAGPLVEDCGLDCLLRAVKVVLMRRSDLLVFLVGKGPAEDPLRRLAESLEIQANVTFTGKLEDWRAVLRAADMLILPSASKVWREEGLAAMAAGVCVIAMDGCVCDGLTEGGKALNYRRGDDSGLAQRITEFLADFPAARRLAGAGQEYVRTHQSPAKMIDAHVRLYRSLTKTQQTLAFPQPA